MRNHEYDWVDDDDLDLPGTMARLNKLEPAVVVAEQCYSVAEPPYTKAGRSETLTKTFYGPQRQAASFA